MINVRGGRGLSSPLVRPHSPWSRCLHVHFLQVGLPVFFVYYEETKREIKRILIYECRCNEGLKCCIKTPKKKTMVKWTGLLWIFWLGWFHVALWEDYRGTRFNNKDSPVVIKRWLNRVEEDASGLPFQEWTPDVDTWFQDQGSSSSSTWDRCSRAHARSGTTWSGSIPRSWWSNNGLNRVFILIIGGVSEQHPWIFSCFTNLLGKC
jgi:hypothetical protein